MTVFELIAKLHEYAFDKDTSVYEERGKDEIDVWNNGHVAALAITNLITGKVTAILSSEDD